MMLFFGRLDAEKGWTKQLHLGAYRSANTRRLRRGRAGHRLRFASAIGRRLAALGAYLDRLERKTRCPR